MKKLILSIVAILLIVSPSTSQTNCTVFHHIGTINSMQYSNNIIWLGTAENGLIQFNKLNENFQYYDTSNTVLNTNEIISVLESNDTLYVSTDSELYFYKNNQFTLINDTINGLLAMMPNWGLVVVDEEIVYFLQNNQITQQKDLNTIVSARGDCCTNNTEVTIDASGNLWISRYAFYEYDVLRFDGTSWMSFHSLNTAELPIESFTFNGMTHQGDSVFVTNWNGIQLYYQGNWSSIYNFSPPFINGTDTVFEPLAAIDYGNRLWLGTDGRDNQQAGRLLYQHLNDWYLTPVMDSLPSIINKIVVNDTRVYIGTSTGFGWLDKACFSVNTLSIRQEESNITIFPNPNNGQFTVTYEQGEWYEIYNINGQIVQQGRLKGEKQTTIIMPHLSKGVYLVRVKAEIGYSTIPFLVE